MQSVAGITIIQLRALQWQQADLRRVGDGKRAPARERIFPADQQEMELYFTYIDE